MNFSLLTQDRFIEPTVVKYSYKDFVTTIIVQSSINSLVLMICHRLCKYFSQVLVFVAKKYKNSTKI